MLGLAPYAAHPEESRGRLYEEPPCATRTVFQRDRDRIVHSTAFRRLIHKTQVFIYHEGDHYRTRLTHSLEVAQIARTLARALGAQRRFGRDASRSPTISATPPFGHAGEGALNKAMEAIGGFDHNAQSLRIVTHLEHRYAAVPRAQPHLGNAGRHRQAQRPPYRCGRPALRALRKEGPAARDPRVRQDRGP